MAAVVSEHAVVVAAVVAKVPTRAVAGVATIVGESGGVRWGVRAPVAKDVHAVAMSA